MSLRVDLKHPARHEIGNPHRVVDHCDIADGTSGDVDANGVPDECQSVFNVDDDAPLGGDGRRAHRGGFQGCIQKFMDTNRGRDFHPQRGNPWHRLKAATGRPHRPSQLGLKDVQEHVAAQID